MNKFFKKLVDKDVVGINYQRRPSSGWVIAGMPNVEISIYLLNMKPLQNKSDNQLTLQNYLSITANDGKSDADWEDDEMIPTTIPRAVVLSFLLNFDF